MTYDELKRSVVGQVIKLLEASSSPLDEETKLEFKELMSDAGYGPVVVELMMMSWKLGVDHALHMRARKQGPVTLEKQ